MAKVPVVYGIVAFRRRAKGSFDHGIVVEKRKEYGNAFDDGGPQFRLDAAPVVVKPSFDGFELLVTVGADRVDGTLRETLVFDVVRLDERSQPLCFSRPVHAERQVVLEAEELQSCHMLQEMLWQDEQEGAFLAVQFGIADFLLEHLGRYRAFIHIEERDVIVGHLVQKYDELHKVRVSLLPERLFASAKQVVD